MSHANNYLKGKLKKRLEYNVKILLVRICKGTTFCSRLLAELEMDAGHELPELVLSRNSARYLLTRDAGEKELLRRTYFLIDKAKSEEEKAFKREREQLLQGQSRMPEIQKLPRCVKFHTAKKFFCGEVKQRPTNGVHRVMHHSLQNNEENEELYQTRSCCIHLMFCLILAVQCNKVHWQGENKIKEEVLPSLAVFSLRFYFQLRKAWHESVRKIFLP